MLTLIVCIVCSCEYNHTESPPSIIPGISNNNSEPNNRNISVHMGSDFSYILCDGIVYAAGDNSFGQFGMPNTNEDIVVVPFENKIDILEATMYNAYALDVQNNLFVFGAVQNEFGIDADSPEIFAEPTLIPFDDEICQISATDTNVLILSMDGKVYECKLSGRKFEVKSIEIEDTVVKVAAGGAHFIALTNNGDIYVWGNNSFGQLGVEDKKAILEPYKLSLDYKIKDIAAGESASYLISVDGNGYSSGTNSYGETGTGSEDYYLTTFKKMDFPSDIKISNIYPATFLFASAVDTNGDLWTWGSNINNSLALGKQSIVYSPMKRNFDTKVNSAAKGGMLYVGQDNKIYVWGSNAKGKLFIDKKIELLTTNTQVFKEEIQ